MTEWMMAHPWMTFFICLAAIEGVSSSIVSICAAVTARRKGKPDKEVSDEA